MSPERESLSRRALLSFASNYNSASDAIMELVDNPIDYRGDRQLHIEVDVDFNAKNLGMPNGRISVRDWGGQGMDIDDMRNWLRWGDGEGHSETDIGQFHVGGKLAAIYLAEKLQVTCRRAGDDRIWHFSDDRWGSRPYFVDLEIKEIPPRERGWIAELDESDGFVQVSLSGIKHGHFTLDDLRGALTDTYETLLESGDLELYVDREPLSAAALPWLSGYEIYSIPDVKIADGVYLNGRVGALNRGALPRGMSTRVLPGIRTDFNGRKITAGESFGVNLDGRGRSQRVYGEISISGPNFRPNQNKTGWDVNSAEWAAITRVVKPLIQQVLRDLEGRPGPISEPTHTPRKRHALSFRMDWLNDDGTEAEEAKQIERAAEARRLQPKEWVKYAIHRELAREAAEAQDSSSPSAWSADDDDIVH